MENQTQVWAVDNCIEVGSCLAGSDKRPHVQTRVPDAKFTSTARAAWECVMGPVPDGMQVLHQNKCSNKFCINVGHLYLGTPFDNVQDWKRKNKTHCKCGLSFDRMYVMSDGKHRRVCSACANRRKRNCVRRKECTNA